MSIKNSWPAGLAGKIADYLAATQSRDGKKWYANGNVNGAAKEFNVSPDSIRRWLNTDAGWSMLDAAKVAYDDMMVNGIKGDPGLSFVEKMAKIQNILADRMLTEAHNLELRYASSSLRDITHTKHLTEEKPTEIVEYLAQLSPAERADELAKAERDLEHAKHESRVGVVKREDPDAS